MEREEDSKAGSRVARFFLDTIYQNGKNISNDHKNTKLL
jgi:hypothetical protein